MATTTRKKSAASKHKNKQASKSAKPGKKTAAAQPKRTSSRAATKQPAPRAHAAKPTTVFREAARSFLDFSHQMVKDYAAPFTDDLATRQPAGNPNHVLWILGHLAGTYHWFASTIDGGSAKSGIPNCDKLFDAGSEPVDDPSIYPSLDEIRRAFDSGRERLEKALATHTDQSLLDQPANTADGWLKSNLDSVLKCAWHNAWHLGHLTYLRRSLGITAKK